MPASKILQVRLLHGYLWTPAGLVDLSEPSHRFSFQQQVLGVFPPVSDEEPSRKKVEHRSSRSAEKPLRFFNRDRLRRDSSHDF